MSQSIDSSPVLASSTSTSIIEACPFSLSVSSLSHKAALDNKVCKASTKLSRTQASLLKMRLQLALYKIETNQTCLPLTSLTSPVSFKMRQQQQEKLTFLTKNSVTPYAKRISALLSHDDSMSSTSTSFSSSFSSSADSDSTMSSERSRHVTPFKHGFFLVECEKQRLKQQRLQNRHGNAAYEFRRLQQFHYISPRISSQSSPIVASSQPSTATSASLASPMSRFGLDSSFADTSAASNYSIFGTDLPQGFKGTHVIPFLPSPPMSSRFLQRAYNPNPHNTHVLSNLSKVSGPEMDRDTDADEDHPTKQRSMSNTILPASLSSSISLLDNKDSSFSFGHDTSLGRTTPISSTPLPSSCSSPFFLNKPMVPMAGEIPPFILSSSPPGSGSSTPHSSSGEFSASMFSITWDTGAGVVTTTASSKSNSSGSNGSNRSSAGSDLVPSGYLNPNMSGEFGSYLLKSYNQPVPPRFRIASLEPDSGNTSTSSGSSYKASITPTRTMISLSNNSSTSNILESVMSTTTTTTTVTLAGARIGQQLVQQSSTLISSNEDVEYMPV